ncbi:MAG: response regulator transcription factor, partial [Deltaproteobacteria bacterium]|nr:response regulator transcription factor [Deltaproteobacteria bacterium]
NYPADAIILDIMLPKMDGITLLSKMRHSGTKTPVIMLTARDAVIDKIKGLDAGADDYLTKPFEFSELVARVRALVRRKSDAKEAIIRIADLEINTTSRDVKRDDKPLQLTSREYTLIEYLAYNAGKVVTRTDIIEHIYSEEFDMDSNVVDVYINYLRNKVDRGFKKKLIHTIRGAGYKLSDNEK